MNFDLTRLSVADTLTCSARLRTAMEGYASVEAIGQQACGFFREAFTDDKGNPAVALARMYVTHPYARLLPAEQRFARDLLNGPVARWPDLKCLVLVATRGEEPEWNDRTKSQGHRAIPLPTASIVEQAPMIAQLFLQMGVELSTVVKAESALFTDLTKRTYNVFHVARALGSPYIPAQTAFVKRFGIESVVGFGGALPWGEHFAVVLFSRATINGRVASRFKTFALDIKSRLLKLSIDQVLESGQDTRLPIAAARQDAETSTSMSTVETSIRTAPGTAGGFRQFRDSRGVEWKVWAVVPAASAIVRTRSQRWQSGWLLFESDKESRRLSPIPPDWQDRLDRELEGLCTQAERKAAR